ncbi:hypothetical protein EJ08DRAFT_722418 [Tothia fuscella]|uniref:Uncharacterized protein n=1 Tax=Tothia fuscella TaxID=1048955 RepID=A0A9P4U319_9PEZI|nr:hypothetical protein EJ08DRAFT_722418 [Tothia fuscella]
MHCDMSLTNLTFVTSPQDSLQPKIYSESKKVRRRCKRGKDGNSEIKEETCHRVVVLMIFSFGRANNYKIHDNANTHCRNSLEWMHIVYRASVRWKTNAVEIPHLVQALHDWGRFDRPQSEHTKLPSKYAIVELATGADGSYSSAEFEEVGNVDSFVYTPNCRFTKPIASQLP